MLFPALDSAPSLPQPPAWPAHQDVGPGWRSLIIEAERLLRTSGVPFTGEIRFRNFYGELWLDISYCSPEVRQALRDQVAAVRELKRRARQTCEVCGALGQPTPRSQGWVSVLCPEHHRARQQGVTWEELMGYRPGNVLPAHRPVCPSDPRQPSAHICATALDTEEVAGTLEMLGTRWRALAAELAEVVPEAAEAYRAAAEELDEACLPHC